MAPRPMPPIAALRFAHWQSSRDIAHRSTVQGPRLPSATVTGWIRALTIVFTTCQTSTFVIDTTLHVMSTHVDDDRPKNNRPVRRDVPTGSRSGYRPARGVQLEASQDR